ncbi:hypothetical protein [Christiangramia forsetii]|uniref:Uncharacterized protein n=2 Tax=Christiangramia forsetii TaxID=411153 RepID=A0LXG5_CHRFK|nr:hypothetical protein [Christiangramia forsetii]GGG36874.1 hypothetical protein GCM10011532_20730 [Christiangramia forsetii]CAL65060.1 hypothetical protein GFO_0070 [Christiangramia forsetii KT0803]
MKTTKLRETVIEYMNNADDDLLEMVKELTEKYQIKQQGKSNLSDEQYKIIRERREKFQEGKTKAISRSKLMQNAKNPHKK